MSIPARMTAIAIREPGPPDVLVPQERDVPAPKAGEVLVKIAAAGVNRPDVMQREGKYPPPPGAPDIPGLEIAGEVVALGEGVQRWKAGDKVDGAGSRRRLCRIHDGARDQRAAGDPASSAWWKPPRSRRRSSRSGTTCSSAARSRRARPC